MKFKLYASGLLLFILLISAGYSSHFMSDDTKLIISGIFVSSDRNWTVPNTTELINFTVKNNESSSDKIVIINITVPAGFVFDNSTINQSLDTWNCFNITPNRIDCKNDSSTGLASGNSINIWFNVTSNDSVATEQTYSWNIDTTDNASVNDGKTLYASIDGKVTNAAEIDALSTYMNLNPLLNWSSIPGTDAVSGIINYTIYHSSDGINYTVYVTTDNSTKTNQTYGLEPNKNHTFIIETTDKAGNKRNSTSIVSTVIDIEAPSVGLNTTNDTTFSNTYTPRLYFNASDNFDSNISCELFVDGSASGTEFIANSTTGKSIITNSSLSTSIHAWYVNCTDDAGNTGNSTPSRTFNIEGPDVAVESVYYNGSDASNLADDSHIMIFAHVKNKGNLNLTNNVTVIFYLDGTSIGTRTITNETLIAGGQVVSVNVTDTTGNLKRYSNTFNHTLKAYGFASGVTELSSTNNNGYNYSLHAGYNVTITNFDATRKPGENQTTVVMVKKPDGNGVTGLDKKNFTITDKFSVYTDVWGGLSLQKPFGTQNVYNDSFDETGGGVYTFKIATLNKTTISVGETTRPGPHTIQVDVQKTDSGKLYKGTDTANYNLTAPLFDLIFKVRGESTDLNGNTDLSESTVEHYNMYIINNGYGNLSNVNITASTTDTGMFSVNQRECPTKNIANIPNDGSLVLICYMSITTNALSSDDSGIIDVVAYGGYNENKYTYSNDDLIISVINLDPASTQSTTTSPIITPASTTDYPNCLANDDCFGDEYCNDHKVCKELSCATDEKIVDHSCVKKETVAAVKNDYQIGIVGAPNEVEIVRGESRNITFKVNNEGAKALTNLNLELKLNDNSEDISNRYLIFTEHSKTIESGLTESIKIELNSSRFPIGTYEIIATAKSSEANKNMTFKLNVMPGDDEKTAINSTIIKLDTEFLELSNKVQVLLHMYPDNKNITELNKSLADVATYLNEAKTAILSSNYLAAYENQKSVESLMADIRSKLEDDMIENNKESHWLRNSIVLIILLIGGVFGFQYYNENLGGNTKTGHHHNRRLRKKEKNTLNSNISKDINILKGLIKRKDRRSASTKPIFEYNNFSKKSVAMHKHKKKYGIFKKFKKIFRKMKRNTKQKTLYDINSIYSKNSANKKKKAFKSVY